MRDVNPVVNTVGSSGRTARVPATAAVFDIGIGSETAQGPLTAYLRTSLNLFALPAARDSGEVPEEALTEMLAQVYDGYTGSRCLIGSVEECLPIVESLAQLGVDEIACLIDFGVPTDTVLAGLEVLARLSEACADV